MRVTNIEYICSECSKPFRLFSDDGSGDLTICWNYCPHCGARNSVWIRFLSVHEQLSNALPVGISYEEAQKLKEAKSKSEESPK